ncbi:hypothetical protein FVE85_7038 [Porphyridium purpureum]|uniref:Uncharacterized protein n=1 Tax=Porphyridium purpureum TaxID=35688 RepID=A0A5J4Z9M4_PORPP|nr:hypothetical protein FVE85_7038 [Porphyridium purpureum]|eukprot:POR7978..scf295_1
MKTPHCLTGDPDHVHLTLTRGSRPSNRQCIRVSSFRSIANTSTRGLCSRRAFAHALQHTGATEYSLAYPCAEHLVDGVQGTEVHRVRKSVLLYTPPNPKLFVPVSSGYPRDPNTFPNQAIHKCTCSRTPREAPLVHRHLGSAPLLRAPENGAYSFLVASTRARQGAFRINLRRTQT